MINIIDDDITDIMTLDLDDLRENERFEAKRCEGKLTSEFWPTYSAFANTFGGDIVLGLKEDPNDRRRLIAVGVGDPDKILNELWTQVNNPQKVSVNLLSEGDVRIEDVDGRNVIIVHVPRAERQKRPVFINGNMNSGTYRRNGEGDYHCSVTEIAEMLRDSRDEPMDSSLCSKVLLRDLEKETVGAYRRMMSNRVPSHPWNKEPDDEFLRLIGAAGYGDDGELRPTVAGVLMFGRDYSIVRELPRYMLDYLEFTDGSGDWTARRTTDTGDWSGNLFDFLTFVSNRINRTTPAGFALEGMVRVDDSDLQKAEREVVLNGIAHADYNGSGGVRVELHPDRLVVRNPGTFRIPIALAESGGHSDPRNPNVMKMFMLVGLVERAGSGVYRMVRTCRELGLGTPVIAESSDPSTVTVTMRIDGTRHGPAEATDSCLSVLDAISGKEDATIAELAEMTGLSTSTVSRSIRRLKDSGRLSREGTRARGRWVVRRENRGMAAPSPPGASGTSRSITLRTDRRHRSGCPLRIHSSTRGIHLDLLVVDEPVDVKHRP